MEGMTTKLIIRTLYWESLFDFDLREIGVQ